MKATCFKPADINSRVMWTWTVWMLPLLSKFILADLPAKPENISCILYYRKNLTCSWSADSRAKYTEYRVNRTYYDGNNSDMCGSNSNSEHRASCSYYSGITPPLPYTLQVEARNADGIIQSDLFHEELETIIKTEAPEILSVKPILGVRRMVQVKWKSPPAPRYYILTYTLRLRTVDSRHWMYVNFRRQVLTEAIETYNLTELQAFTKYVVSLRCKVEESRFWSDWSQEKTGTTEEEAPYGLDVWRVLGPAEADGIRTVQVLWKKAKGAPVLEKNFGYTLWYFPENTTLRRTQNTTEQQYKLTLEGKAYWVCVVAYNTLGKSPVAKLRIPAVEEKAFQCIKFVQARLTQGQLVVEWQSSKPEVNMWVLEWFKDVDSEPPTLSWESVSHTWNWTIEQDQLESFWCYNITVYPVLQHLVGEPYSIQAYVKEGAPSASPATKAENVGVKTATITWKEIPKSQRRGFIRNYTIFYQAEDGKEFSKTVNSTILQYDLESLTRKTSYTVWIMASTSVGGINSTSINFKTLSISIHEIILISFLVGGGLLILIILVVAYGLRKPNKLKLLCWPSIPNPAKSSVAIWPSNDSKNKLNLKEFGDSMSTEDDKTLKSSAASDLIDKLVVNYENFLEEVSIEESRKGQEVVLGGEENKYVTFPSGPTCQLEKTFEEVPVSTDRPPGKSSLCSVMSEESYLESEEQFLSSAPSLNQDYFCEEDVPNPYLKNSVTTREFLMSENSPDQSKRD
ncbi:interleukin-31 receptor subunit alpha [Erinaceus europaeus]|uniref:Interleukin-31 receptor subunit alpha n=1 Tax=Erinaceus europaeus TaxID=9365 RepID=A0A1S2ZGC9_ERIEU|nr:interleukin-31 receptor subunit alpha [Erinaceus europaeus]